MSSGTLTSIRLYSGDLHEQKEEFQEFQENEGWEEDEDNEGESRAAQALSFEGMSALAPEWKRLLNMAAGFMRNLRTWSQISG